MGETEKAGEINEAWERNKGRTRKWHSRRREILKAAETIFAERGYQAAKLEHVAEVVNMQRPSLHYYFNGKEALYDAVITEIIEGFLAELERIPDSTTPPKQLEAISQLWLDFAVWSPNGARLLLEQLVDRNLPGTPSAVKPRRRLFQLIEERLEAVLPPSGPNNLDPTLYILVESGMSLLWVCMRDNVRKRLGYDTLAPRHLNEYRSVLMRLSRGMLGDRVDA